MCGIIGYVGKEKALPIIISGLKALEYRGYDSAGVAYLDKDKIKIVKEKGKIVNLEEKLNFDTDTYLGIGHTRWATHGSANKVNAHPHSVGDITLVHNGIIENYGELKKELESIGYKFKSETDSEIAAALIDKLYHEKKDILLALSETTKLLKGSYAIGIMVKNDNNLYAIRNTSPLIVAFNDNGSFIASDVPAILDFTNKYMLIEDKEIVKLCKDNITIYNNDLKVIKRDINTFMGSREDASKNGYKHFMLKEINEEDKVFKDTVNYYFDGSMQSLEKSFGFIKKYKKIDIVACGSAYHTGVIGKCLLEEYGNIPVNVEVASEYRYKKCFYDEETLVICVSQSGETADTLAALRKCKNDGIKTMAIVNVVGSSIAREADEVVYIKAGFEIAVATTKAYLAQLAIFGLMAMYLGYINNILGKNEIKSLINDINRMPVLIKNTINNNAYKIIADKIYKNKDIFFIGRGIDYALSLEASLKLKEVSYINSVAYQAGELKHGTISLIDKGTPIIAIATDINLFDKMVNNIKEVKARGAYVILVSTIIPKEKFYDEIIVVNKIHKIWQSIIAIIPMQLLAYKVALNNGCDIDKPKNLAKSVTVE